MPRHFEFMVAALNAAGLTVSGAPAGAEQVYTSG
jgi:hypothetical protein